MKNGEATTNRHTLTLMDSDGMWAIYSCSCGNKFSTDTEDGINMRRGDDGKLHAVCPVKARRERG